MVGWGEWGGLKPPLRPTWPHSLRGTAYRKAFLTLPTRLTHVRKRSYKRTILTFPTSVDNSSQLKEVVSMKIVVQPQKQGGESLWQVRLDQHCVSFRSEEEARQFVATLEARLRAPHRLPERAKQRRAS